MELFLHYFSETFAGLIVPVLVAFVACIGFGIIFNIRGINLLLAAGCGAVGWLVYLVVVHYSSEILACFLGGVAVSLYAEIIARPRRTPSTCFMIIGMLPLVPGAGVYYTMKYLVQGDYTAFGAKGLNTLACAGAIALGLMWVISMVRLLLHIQQHKRRKKLQK